MIQLQEEEWAVDEEEFETVVQRMVWLNFLTPISANGQGKKASSAEAALADGVFASALAQYVMLRDFQRVLTYKSAIFRHVAGRDMLEIGCGTGILSIFAAQAGAEVQPGRPR